MKNKDFAALSKRLIVSFPDCAVHGPMLVMFPVKFLLRGIYFERSSFDAKSFYVWVFFLPLFIPTNHVNFNLGRRLRVSGGGDRWSTDMQDLLSELAAVIKSEALPFLSGIESPLDIVKAVGKMQVSQDPYVQQTVAYAWARAGEVVRANEELEKLLRLLDTTVAWQRAISDRATNLKVTLSENPTQAQVLLERWEVETVHNLGLQKWQ